MSLGQSFVSGYSLQPTDLEDVDCVWSGEGYHLLTLNPCSSWLIQSGANTMVERDNKGFLRERGLYQMKLLKKPALAVQYPTTAQKWRAPASHQIHVNQS